MFVCDGHKDCHEGEDEICKNNVNQANGGSQLTSKNETFKCNLSGISIHRSFVNDLIPNCPGSFEDEMQYYSLLTVKHHPFNACNSNYELPCVFGHSYCFPLSKVCIYDLDHNSLQLRYCRNGAHLYNCTNFQCPGYFKCPLSYCISFDLVCNSIWDCPGGFDEMNCTSHSCSYLFKCRSQTKCLHFSKICDTIKDCILGDEELSCSSMYTLSCPVQCFCFAQSIVCDQLTYLLDLKLWNSTKYFKCYNCTFALPEFFTSFSLNLKFLDFKNYLLKDICISKFSSLKKVDISYNKISIIKSHCFRYLPNLNSLYLQNNIICIVENKDFHTLSSLRILDLSCNRISKISEGIFIGLHNIKVVNLALNFITRIYPNAFNALPQNTIYSLNRQVCCMSGAWVKCEVKTDQFMNCNVLLSNKAVSYTCFSVAILTILLNLISIVIHIKLFSELQTNKFFTLSLSLVDCLYGLYLLIINN